MAPGQLQDHIWANEIVACVEHTNVALAAANVDELDQVLVCDYEAGLRSNSRSEEGLRRFLLSQTLLRFQWHP